MFNSKRSLKKSFYVGLLIFIILILLRLFFAQGFSSLSYKMAEPFWNLRDYVFGKSPKIGMYTESRASLEADIKSLETELYNAQVENLALSAKYSTISNSPFTSVLTNKENRITVKVISKPPSSPYDSLILGQGKEAGIISGTNVYIGDNILIGKISEVENSYSKVILFSSGLNSNQADILRTGESVTLHGRSGGNFNVTLPKDSDVVIGDLLVDTSAHQNIIAKVYYIDSSSLDSFKKVYARIPVNILQSEWVSVSISL
jgi:cell shape-determining protein MreC